MAGIKKLTVICVVVTICNICHVAKTDTKVLGNINVSTGVYQYGDTRKETISLDNNQNLVIKGQTSQKFRIEKDSDDVYVLILNYEADKNGNRVTYKLTKEKDTHQQQQYLSISTLKSSTG